MSYAVGERIRVCDHNIRPSSACCPADSNGAASTIFLLRKADPKEQSTLLYDTVHVKCSLRISQENDFVGWSSLIRRRLLFKSGFLSMRHEINYANLCHIRGYRCSLLYIMIVLNDHAISEYINLFGNRSFVKCYFEVTKLHWRREPIQMTLRNPIWIEIINRDYNINVISLYTFRPNTEYSSNLFSTVFILWDTEESRSIPQRSLNAYQL